MSLAPSFRPAATLALLVTVLSACQRGSMKMDRSAPSLSELRNAGYSGLVEAGGAAVKLTNGRWTGNPYAKGGASVASVRLLADFRFVADFDHDDREEAAVLLLAQAGGTGATTYLSVVARDGAGLRNVATAPVGDRVQVRAARLEDGRIVLDVVQAGVQDASCCPGDLVTRTWEWKSQTLVEGTPKATGRLSLAALGESEWVLRSWTPDEPAPAKPKVTLKVEDGRFAGEAGCNRYFTSVTPGKMPGEFATGPAGVTRKMCGKAEMTVESRFLRQLAGAQRFEFIAGRLGIDYATADGKSGTMLFEHH